MSSTDTPQATRANWRTAPFTHWSFRNVPALVPVHEIAADPATLRPLAEASQPLDGFSVSLGPKSFDLPTFLAATATDALLVLQDGRIVHEFYGNGLTAETPHILMSMSKAVTGLVVGILCGRGVLDPAAPVRALVPEIARTSYRDTTIRQLLDMRGGAVIDAPAAAAYARATNWEALPDGETADLHGFFASLADVPGSPGGPFKYDSANTDLLGWAIERAAGQSFAALASELLWRPMGAQQAGYITVDGHGAPRCTGGVGAAARDVARMGQLVLDGGARDGQQIVPADWIADLWQGGDAEAWRTGEFGKSFAAMGLGTMRYRSGWYEIDGDTAASPRTLFGMGIHGQNLFVVPQHRMVIVKLSSPDNPLDPIVIALAHRAVAEIARCLEAAA